MIEWIMMTISDNRVWILSLFLVIEVPFVFYIAGHLLSDGYKELKDLKE